MKFSDEKKNSIKMYILEKIEQKTESLSKYVSNELGISQNTVHSYLSELLEKGIITKSKRGAYELVSKKYEYTFSREKGELENDTHAYNECLYPLIKHLPENVIEIWDYTMSEMVNNVIDHSDAEKLDLYIEHNYFTTRVFLIDNGVGIFKKIKEHFSLASFDDAICELFKGKLTTDIDNHSGEGIFFSSKMMDEFLIFSSGKIFTVNKYDDEKVLNFIQGIQGTCVCMSLSNFTNKTAAEIFDLYSNVDGGFAKTRIPLKNIFDKSPVSRSQAKRICNRLEQFKEVIVDFEGVNWMGQGFAHQLFVVWQKNHPSISLLPINMNDDVKNMYSHVMGAM